MAAGRVRTSPLESLMPLKLKVSEDGGGDVANCSIY